HRGCSDARECCAQRNTARELAELSLLRAVPPTGPRDYSAHTHVAVTAGVYVTFSWETLLMMQNKNRRLAWSLLTCIALGVVRGAAQGTSQTSAPHVLIVSPRSGEAVTGPDVNV